MSNYLTFVIAIATFLLCGRLDAFETSRPNIVVFIADDHGYLDSSLAGAKEFRTPTFERIAREGITLTHAFAASPSCAPSRAAFLTGLMPIRNGAMLNHQPPRAGAKKLPAYLHELGYEAVAIGKVAHYKQAREYGFDCSSHDTFHDDACVAAAVEFLKQRKSTKPLCLLVGTNWPHVPWPDGDTGVASRSSYRPPPTHVDTPATRKWRARYAAAVERCDHDLGLLYEEAYQRLGPNTLFIEFSDHGAQWPFGKWNLYDAGTRTTLFAKWPGKITPGTRSTALVNLVDLLPTLIDAAGGKVPKEIDGRSFLAVLTGNQHEFRGRVFTTHSGDGKMNSYPQRSIRTNRWKYIRNLRPDAEHHTHIDLGKPVDGSEYWASWMKQARTDPHAASVVERYRHRPAEELYDLDADPNEQRNLAADPGHNQRIKDLRADLNKWMAEQGDRGLLSEQAAADAFPEAMPKPLANTYDRK
jgi:N-sulfoglucosamine sulfohydrolase